MGHAAQALVMASGASVISIPASLGTHIGSASASTSALTTTATVPAGGVVFVTAMFAQTTTISISSITDSNGNTYQRAVSAGWNATGIENQELWYAVSASALNAGAVITVTLSQTPNANTWSMAAAFATGLIATPLDKTSSAKFESGTGTLASGATAALAQAKELVIGATGFYNSTTFTEDATFTQINDLDAGGTGHLRSHLAYKIVNATTAVNYQPSVNTSVFGGSMVATFKGA